MINLRDPGVKLSTPKEGQKPTSNPALKRDCAKARSPLAPRLGDAARRPNGPAAVARGARRDPRPEPAAAPDTRCTTCGCSAPAGEPRGL